MELTASRLVRGMKWMPVVGLFIGLPASLLAVSLSPLVGYEVAVLIGLIFQIGVTGGLHLDGLADSADGLFSYRPRERVLEIMRDSTLGTNGVVALCLTILSKYVLLQSMPQTCGFIVLVAVPILGRTAAVWHAASAGYAREGEGMGRFVNQTTLRQGWAALLCSFVLLGVVFAVAGLSLWSLLLLLFCLHALCVCIAVFLARYMIGRIGGITGDTIGATIELTEVFSLFFFLLIWSMDL